MLVVLELSFMYHHTILKLADWLLFMYLRFILRLAIHGSSGVTGGGDGGGGSDGGAYIPLRHSQTGQPWAFLGHCLVVV